MSRRISAARARRRAAEEAERLLGAIFREFLKIPEVVTYLNQWNIHMVPSATAPIRITRRAPEEAAGGCAQP